MHLLGWILNLSDWIGRFVFSIACIAALGFGAGFGHAQGVPASPDKFVKSSIRYELGA
jgi:hypothetical protein